MPRHRHARPPRVRYHFTIRYFSDLVCPTMPRSSVAPQALKLGKQRPPTLEIRGKKLARPLLLTGQHRSSPSPGHDIIQPHRREAHASRHVCTAGSSKVLPMSPEWTQEGDSERKGFEPARGEPASRGVTESVRDAMTRRSLNNLTTR